MDHMEKARQLRASTDIHFNCCQSVLAAFAQDMGLSEQQAYALGQGFGGGMQCGSTCGALTGALMVLGLTSHPQDQIAAYLRKFRESHGDINCAVLLRASHEEGIPRKEHCDGLVFEAVEALDQAVQPCAPVDEQ